MAEGSHPQIGRPSDRVSRHPEPISRHSERSEESGRVQPDPSLALRMTKYAQDDEPEHLLERLRTLEETLQATMNLLEDFDEERRKYQQIQKASLNLLEDVNEERNRLNKTQGALLNMLEDFEVERVRSQETQQATTNLLEDFDEERRKYQQIQKASLNLLEDVNEERNRLNKTQGALLNMLDDFEAERAKTAEVQQATMNLLEDFDEERRKYQLIQKASLNLLEDVNEERSRLDETQRALMNMLDDFEVERARTEQAKEQLEVANKELEAFSYSVSHDLRAPLRAIEGFSTTLVNEYRDRLDERGQDYLSRVAAAAERMGRLIDDILGLSRASRAEMYPQPVNLSKMAEEIIDSLRKDEPERQAEINIQPNIVVQADEHLLRIAMTNLLGNAWKFTSKRPVARIAVNSSERNGELVYCAKDNGAGFKMAYADKLFIPFQRLHKERDFPGTGIGLALVQRIVRRHGGRIWAEGAVDRGATFCFTLGGPRENGPA